MNPKFPIWQVTLPLAVVAIFTMGAVTTIYMSNGGYIFQFGATPKRVKIKTRIDKNNFTNHNQLKNAQKNQQETDYLNKDVIP